MDADIHLARCGSRTSLVLFPSSSTAQWLGYCICHVLDLMGLAARWLCSKYSKKGKRYFNKFGTQRLHICKERPF